MELREAAMALQEENLALREKVNRLESDLNRTKQLHLRNGVYWLDGDAVPLCQVCYEKDEKLIHLEDGKAGNKDWHCPVCARTYGKAHQ